MGYGLLLAYVLTPVAMGEFSVAVSAALIAATVSKFGLDAYLMRYAASHSQELQRVAIRCLCVAGFGGGIIWTLCVWAGIGLDVGMNTATISLLLGIPFLAMSYVLTGLLKASDFPATAVFLETGGWQSALCLLAVGMLVIGSDSLLVVAVCFTVSSVLVFAGCFLATRHRIFGTRVAGQDVRPISSNELREVLALTGLNIGNVLMRWSDTLWVAWWLGPSEVAVYTICTRLAGGIAFIDNAVNAVSAPRFAHYFERRETEVLQREFKRACFVSGVWGVVGAVVIALFGPFFLDGLGSPYSEASDILLLAALAMAAQIVWVPIGHLSMMSGRALDHFQAIVIALLAQQLVFLLFIPKFGMMGAVFGFASSRILAYLITFLKLRRYDELGFARLR